MVDIISSEDVIGTHSLSFQRQQPSSIFLVTQKTFESLQIQTYSHKNSKYCIIKSITYFPVAVIKLCDRGNLKRRSSCGAYSSSRRGVNHKRGREHGGRQAGSQAGIVLVQQLRT